MAFTVICDIIEQKGSDNVIIPMLDDDPILDEIAERNIRENEKMRLLLRMQKCKTLEDFQKLTKELEESIK